ncbi:MAG: spermine synthase [Wenzhouxiangella sp.]|nr:MAG: spermine synthase [Wenzhouxiangella sp.]
MTRTPAHLGSVLMMGLVSQIAQVVMLRELLMLFHGNELTIGIILAAWMACVGVGSAIGAVVAERTERILPVMALNASLLLPVLVIGLLVTRGLRGLFDVVPGAYLTLNDITLASFLILAPACLLIGMQFVLLAKLWRRHDRSEDTSGAGKTYIGEALGNIIGGAAFTLALVHLLNPFQIVLAVGALVMLAVLWAARHGTHSAGRLGPIPKRMMWLLLIAAAATIAGASKIDDFGHRLQWSQIAPEHALVEVRQSKHGNIAVARMDDQITFFRSGHLMFSAAGPETAQPQLEEQDAAIFAHFALSQHPAPERVLLIGGGFRGTLGEILKHPVTQVDYVELDPVLTQAARDHLAPAILAALDSPRVRLVHDDARRFLRRSDARWDVILIDVPDPNTAVLNRYYTDEFFTLASQRLASSGLLVIGAVSTPGLRGQAVANRNATILHTLEKSFRVVVPVGERFLIYLATQGESAISTDPGVLRQRHLDRAIHSPAFSPAHYYLLLEPGQLHRVNWILRQHGRSPADHLKRPQAAPLRVPGVADQLRLQESWAPVHESTFINSDFRPLGYFYSLLFWSDLTRSEQTRQLARLMEIRAEWILAPVIGLLSLMLLLRLLGKRGQSAPDRRLAVGIAVFTTGMATMAMQIALLFAFQSQYGFVYEMIGLIVALFMAGLASGTLFAQTRIKQRSSLRLLAWVQAGIAVFALGIAWVLPLGSQLPGEAATFLFFAGLTFISGLLNGIDFPLATEAFRAHNRRAERSAGLVYGIELAGACIGAALASVIVAPIMGVVACCLLAAIANATAWAALMIARR